jgi:hypothetical protein
MRYDAIDRNWICWQLQPGKHLHMFLPSCPHATCHIVSTTLNTSISDIWLSHHSATPPINPKRDPNVPDLGTKGSSALLLRRGENWSWWKNGSEAVQTQSFPLLTFLRPAIGGPRPRSLDLRLRIRETLIAFLRRIRSTVRYQKCSHMVCAGSLYSANHSSIYAISQI